MNSVGLSDQLWNVYQVDHWMRKYKWWWSLLFLVHGLILVNVYIIYKTLRGEVKVKPISHYEFRCLVRSENIDTTPKHKKKVWVYNKSNSCFSTEGDRK